jgi:hypothetical protein
MKQGAVGRQAEDRAEVKGESCATRVIATGRIDEQDGRPPRQRLRCRFQERAFAEDEQAGLIGRSRCACDGRRRLLDRGRGRGPPRVALPARAGPAALEADEAASHDERRRVAFRFRDAEVIDRNPPKGDFTPAHSDYATPAFKM